MVRAHAGTPPRHHLSFPVCPCEATAFRALDKVHSRELSPLDPAVLTAPAYQREPPLDPTDPRGRKPPIILASTTDGPDSVGFDGVKEGRNGVSSSGGAGETLTDSVVSVVQFRGTNRTPVRASVDSTLGWYSFGTLETQLLYLPCRLLPQSVTTRMLQGTSGRKEQIPREWGRGARPFASASSLLLPGTRPLPKLPSLAVRPLLLETKGLGPQLVSERAETWPLLPVTRRVASEVTLMVTGAGRRNRLPVLSLFSFPPTSSSEMLP